MTWLRTEDDGLVRWLILDRPKRKNAVPREGWKDLRDAFAGFERSQARVLVVRGAGEDFCSGADLDPAERAELSSATVRHRRMRIVGETALDLHRLGKPTLAAVDGVAAGAGMNLALGCDLVICSQRARFAEIFVRRGLALDFGGSWLLPRMVGMQRAKELALTGRIVDAEEAVSLGIALEQVDPGRLYDRAAELAEALVGGAPFAQSLIKRTMSGATGSSFAAAVAAEGEAQVVALGTRDAAEGVASFLERRPPRWEGR